MKSFQQEKIRLPGHQNYHPVNLSEHFNNDGISYDAVKCDGAFDGNGCTFPAEDLPESNSIVSIDEIPFFFPSKENGQKNNMVLRRQVFPIEARRYRTLYVLGASEGANGDVFEEEAAVRSSQGRQISIYIGLSNWLLEPVFNEKIGFAASHLHYPDPGQSINRNTFAETEHTEYAELTSGNAYSSREYFADQWKTVAVGDWKPKIWLATINIPTDSVIDEISFLEENLNFHIFSMTLQSDD